ncbi:MAG: protein phosphatase 2C domain-containing protein [Clostridia bacterium]|nr:protein phosphatase 2C domain-containing protein [Clostridia bacterium]
MNADNNTVYRAERFLLGKKGDPALCEDVIVECAHFCAVIDGVTSKSERLYNGKAGGRYAAELVASVIESFDGDETAEQAFCRIDRALAAACPPDAVPPEARTQACAVIYSKRRREVWNYGDCQLMINEQRITHSKVIDDVLSALRAFVISAYLAQGGDPAALAAHDVGREAILPYAKHQSLFANQKGYFGYPVLDGSGICTEYIKIYPVAAGDHVVLASDGYPKLFSTLAESEAHLQTVLKTDPLAIGANMQTKMPAPGACSFDDRAYLSFFAE